MRTQMQKSKNDSPNNRCPAGVERKTDREQSKYKAKPVEHLRQATRVIVLLNNRFRWQSFNMRFGFGTWINFYTACYCFHTRILSLNAKISILEPPIP